MNACIYNECDDSYIRPSLHKLVRNAPQKNIIQKAHKRAWYILPIHYNYPHLLLKMFKLTLLSVAALAASLVSAETARFSFQTQEQREFVIELTDDAKIAHARRILSGEETDEVHVMGRVIKSPQPYNPVWSYHLDPDTIQFFMHAIEVCDANVSYIEYFLDDVCGAFLPGCFFCPWTSKLIREIKPE